MGLANYEKHANLSIFEGKSSIYQIFCLSFFLDS